MFELFACKIAFEKHVIGEFCAPVPIVIGEGECEDFIDVEDGAIGGDVEDEWPNVGQHVYEQLLGVRVLGRHCFRKTPVETVVVFRSVVKGHSSNSRDKTKN